MTRTIEADDCVDHVPLAKDCLCDVVRQCEGEAAGHDGSHRMEQEDTVQTPLRSPSLHGHRGNSLFLALASRWQAPVEHWWSGQSQGSGCHTCSRFALAYLFLLSAIE